MLVSLITARPGLSRTAALVLLSVSALFTIALFGVQRALPDRFGCTLFGEDYAILQASSQLILSGEGSSVYAPSILGETHAAVLAQAQSTCALREPVMAYWLAFLLPFLPLTLFSAKLGYYLWTSLTVLMFVISLWRLSTASRVSPWSYWFVALSFYPVTLGLLEGQMHGLQFLALTEFWLSLRRQSDRSAGLWLSLQLVKLQFLPLLLLYLAWRRRWRTIIWFTVGGVVWLALTVFMANGVQGISNYFRMMLDGVASPNAPTGVNIMFNWRALALNWLDSGPLGLIGVVSLTLCTIGLIVWSWHQRPKAAADFGSQEFLILIAGTLLIGYDTHIPSAVLLLAPALPILAEMARQGARIAWFWSVLLDFTFLAPSLLAALSLLFVFTQVTLFWILPAQALLTSCIAIVLGGIMHSSIRASRTGS